MNRNIITKNKVILILLIFAIATLFYWNNSSKKTAAKKTEIIEKKDDSTTKNTSTIKNILYNNSDNFGNNYIVKASEGVVDIRDTKIINLKNVRAVIKLKDRENIYINAKKAKYNFINYNTFFEDSVIMKFSEHKIESNELDLLLSENLAKISNNVFYMNKNTKLYADKVEVDLITKNSKIYMINKVKPVQIFFDENGNN